MNILIWGLFLIVLGVSFIIKALFGWDIPIFKVALGIALIYWGIQVLFDTQRPFCTINRKYNANSSCKGYSTVFGSQTINLSEIRLSQKPTYLQSNTVFGTTEIILDKDIPTELIINATFGTVELPKSGLEMVDSRRYVTPSGDKKPHLILTINCTFGTVLIKTG